MRSTKVTFIDFLCQLQNDVQDVAWGDLDALIIDTPPGTSDEHITVMESLRESATTVTGAVLVTTPQAVAVGDVRCVLHRTGIYDRKCSG